ncbi:MAG: polymer-forming cytoskeletal protein [Burkholderiaceae bacterium]|nr:polymer-forming cytoskeletal protein [Burkholderiaceae bacterium]
MLGIKKPPSVKSIVGSGMRIEGPVTFQDGLQIEGVVAGDITAQSDQPNLLVIAEAGAVHGAIRADRVVIAGKVAGSVYASGLVELLATANVQGDIEYKRLEMQQGALVEGRLQPMLTPPPPADARHANGAVKSGPALAAPVEPSLESAPLPDAPQIHTPGNAPEKEKRPIRLF